ncbi:MAG: GNAT family protein [Acidimicrobiia bacterium]|nr:GNAT family protein [Acidimicrobiia bacterium]
MITPLQPQAGLPPDYPFDYERHLSLEGGHSVYVRPIVPGDAALLQEAAEVADADTLYQRFFNPTVRLNEKRLRFLTEVDYVRRFALVAFSDGEGVAIARFEPAGEGIAEVAVVVEGSWRRRGLATALLDLLEEAALERGINTLEAYYLPENHAIERVLEKRGFGGTTVDGGVARVTRALGRAR